MQQCICGCRLSASMQCCLHHNGLLASTPRRAGQLATARSLQRQRRKNGSFAHRRVGVIYRRGNRSIRHVASTPAYSSSSQDLLRQTLQLSQTEADDILSTISASCPNERQLASNLQLLCSWRSQAPRLRSWLKKWPPVLTSVDLAAWYDFLSTFGYTRINFLQLVVHHPEVLQEGSLFNAGSIIFELQCTGLSERAITDTVLPTNPAILLLSPTQQLKPLLQQLEQLGVALPGIPDLISRAPKLLTQPQPLQQQLQYLTSLGFTPSSLKQLLYKDASVLTQDVQHSLVPRVTFLQEAGYTGNALVTLLAGDPTLLCHALPGIMRKHEFLVRVMCLGPAAVLQQYPCYYSESLMTKIGPRYSYVSTHQLQQLVTPGDTRTATQASSLSPTAVAAAAHSNSSETAGPRSVSVEGDTAAVQQQQQQQPAAASSAGGSSSSSSWFRGHPVANNKLLPKQGPAPARARRSSSSSSGNSVGAASGSSATDVSSTTDAIPGSNRDLMDTTHATSSSSANFAPPAAASESSPPSSSSPSQPAAAHALPGDGPAGTAPAACSTAAPRVHLGLLLTGDDSEWSQALGLDVQEYCQYAAEWATGEGLHWSGVRATF